YDYDELNRRTTETWVASGGVNANVIRFTYDPAGNLLTVNDNVSSLTYTYDTRNRVISVDNLNTPNAPHVVSTYTYDAVGNVLTTDDTIEDQPGGKNNYTYDGLNRMVRITQTGPGISPKRVDFTYNEIGEIDTIRRYRDLAGTQLVVSSDYDYDD